MTMRSYQDGSYRRTEQRAKLINALVEYYGISFAAAEDFIDQNHKYDWLMKDINLARSVKRMLYDATSTTDLESSLRHLEWMQEGSR